MRISALSISSFALFCLLVLTRTARADDIFYESDDYQEGEAGVVNAFLHDPEYRLMVEDLERNDTSFDWGWVRTVEFQPENATATGPEPTPAEKGLRGRMKTLLRGGSTNRRMESEVRKPLAFDLREHRAVWIPDVQNFAGIAKKELLDEIHGAFVEGVLALGLVPSSADDADLELGLALVDQLRGAIDVPVYNIEVKPHIALELRLTNLRTGEDLLLVRNRKHGTTQAEAALNFADDLVKFLR
jgi:hypothetical protein